MKKNKRQSKSIRFLTSKNGEYFIKMPNLSIPIKIDKYLFEKWSQQSGFKPLNGANVLSS